MRVGPAYIGCGFGATAWEWQVGPIYGSICFMTGGGWNWNTATYGIYRGPHENGLRARVAWEWRTFKSRFSYGYDESWADD